MDEEREGAAGRKQDGFVQLVGALGRQMGESERQRAALLKRGQVARVQQNAGEATIGGEAVDAVPGRCRCRGGDVQGPTRGRRRERIRRPGCTAAAATAAGAADAAAAPIATTTAAAPEAAADTAAAAATAPITAATATAATADAATSGIPPLPATPTADTATTTAATAAPGVAPDTTPPATAVTAGAQGGAHGRSITPPGEDTGRRATRTAEITTTPP